MPKFKLTYDEAVALRPCSVDKIPSFGRRKFMTARQALAAGVSVEDLLWVAGRMGLGRECVQFSLAVAQRVAHLNPDPRVQAALDATAAFLADPSEANRLACERAAAEAARAAAEAWAEAWAAARAAEAAEAAARAAEAWARAEAWAWARAEAWARAAAEAAAWARAAAARAAAAEREEQKRIFLEIFDA